MNRLMIITSTILGLLFCLIACAPSQEVVSVTRRTVATATAVPSTPSPTATSARIRATETAVRQLEPGVGSTATPRPLTPPPNPTSAAPPALSDAALAQIVQSGLPCTAVDGVENYPLCQISSFDYGFRYAGYGYCEFGPYRWLTNDQLMIFPIVAYTTWFENPTFGQVTQPIIINHTDGSAWMPSISRTDVCNLPVWSAAQQRVIEASNGEVRLRDLAGNVTATYPGTLPLFIAPSGQRVLAGHTWIDLNTDEVITLEGWQQVKFPRPTWSSDERRIFECCFSYVDVDTAVAWKREGFGFYTTGIGVGPGHTGSGSQWMANDTLILPQPSGLSFWHDPRHPIVPLIDPEAQTHVDLVDHLQLPETVNQCGTAAAPSGNHAWLTCSERVEQDYHPYFETSYLLSLPSLDAIPVMGKTEFRGWSANGRFLAYNQIDDAESRTGTTWLMAIDGTAQQVAEQSTQLDYWHSTASVAALLLHDTQTVQFINAATNQSRLLTLDQPITEIVWQTDETGVALLDENGRLLWLADPFDTASQPVPLTPALPDVHSLRWSPNGRSLAFISETNLYVVALGGE